MLAVAVPQAGATTVFDNTTVDLSVRFNPDTTEVGDEVVLAGTERALTNFTFGFYGLSLDVTAQARVRFYLNDGVASASGSLTPFSVFYDSGLFNISSTERATMIFNQATLLEYNGIDIVLPDSFTWSVQFSTLGAGASAGVDLYSPPGTGSSYDDYWDNGPGGWQLMTNGTTPMNFAARFEAQTVPEPSVLWLGLVGGGLGWMFRFRSRQRA